MKLKSSENVCKEQNRSRLFNGIARHYDRMNDLFSFMTHHYWRKVLIEKAHDKEESMILDLCTGTADVALALSRKKKQCHIFGCDYSFLMLQEAQNKIVRGKAQEKIQLVLADGLNMPFDDQTFDVIFNSFGLRNEADIPQALREMKRVCKPGGEINVLEFNSHPHKLISHLYRWYLSCVIPSLAKGFIHDSAPYRYLADSVKEFLTLEEMVACLKKENYSNIKTISLTGGIAVIYRANV